jgi:DNA-directed RNA polymerase specialized sigma subunit
MAVPVQRIGGDMEQQEPKLDRAYTISRIEFMLENYHALLCRKPMSIEDKAQMSSVVTSDSQWWNAQAYWRRVDRKADLDSAIDHLQKVDGRMYLIVVLRFRSDPHERLTWENVGDSLATSRSQVGRLYIRALTTMAWYLGGVRDA